MSILRNESIISGLSDLSHRPELDKKKKRKRDLLVRRQEGRGEGSG